jgi:hypothetical protein
VNGGDIEQPWRRLELSAKRMASRVIADGLMILAVVSTPVGAGQVSGAPETVVIRHGTITLQALLYHPEGRGPFPAVLLISATPVNCFSRVSTASCSR